LESYPFWKVINLIFIMALVGERNTTFLRKFLHFSKKKKPLLPKGSITFVKYITSKIVGSLKIRYPLKDVLWCFYMQPLKA